MGSLFLLLVLLSAPGDRLAIAGQPYIEYFTGSEDVIRVRVAVARTEYVTVTARWRPWGEFDGRVHVADPTRLRIVVGKPRWIPVRVPSWWRCSVEHRCELSVMGDKDGGRGAHYPPFNDATPSTGALAQRVVRRLTAEVGGK